MNSLHQTATYLAAKASRIGRRVFRNDRGALTLEWIVIAALLVAAVALAKPLFDAAVTAAGNQLGQ
jgi:hypothetical protein